MLKSINPYNNETIATYEELNETQLHQVVSRSNDAFKVWRNVKLAERLQVINRVAQLIDEGKYELAKLATLEMGKLYLESVAEVQKCGRLCKYYVEHAEEHLQKEII